MRNNTNKKHKKTKNHTSKNQKRQKRQKQNTRKNTKKNHRRTQKNGGMIRNFFRTLGFCRPNTDGVIDPRCIVDKDKITRVLEKIKIASDKELLEKEKDYEIIIASLSLDEYNVIIKKWEFGINNKKIFIKKYVPFLTKRINTLSNERQQVELSNLSRQKETINQIKESNKKRSNFISRPTTSRSNPSQPSISLNDIDVSKEYSPKSFKKEIDKYKKELREHKKIGDALSNNSKKGKTQSEDDDKMYEDFLKSI